MTTELSFGGNINSFTDLSSPYFLHPSDNPGAILVSFLLNRENYPTWRWVMINVLSAKNKIEFVSRTISKSDLTRLTELRAWSKCNCMVVSWLFNVLARELHQSVAYIEMTREIWLDLEQRFSQGNAPWIFHLKHKLVVLHQENLSVASYYTKMKGIWDELSVYTPV
ncbi:PREDICTED: uncharacterized protein LOC109114373 [Nelumbo nucifera]|uniref:Uncharacterized protein LOC109114373 n=1 Tax=Nelumbo nucifera TaxID=4432 RepID=A0A1U8Q0W9_NELNU|nr:PREDICTED: uncharacterized protein LOC109114373 [Nelumbo nucifera]